MKKLLCIVAFLMLNIFVFGTVPEAIKYQAVARDNNGNVLSNRPVSIRLSILKTNVSGATVYVKLTMQ